MLRPEKLSSYLGRPALAPANRSRPPTPAVVLDDLSFAYPPATPGSPAGHVLRRISFSVPAGQAVALMGPTSSGKTTLALVLAGLAPAMTGGVLQGRATVNGLDVAQTPAARLSAHLGLVFQEPERQLFNMTVADEVAFGLEGLALPLAEIEARVAWALDRVDLAGLEDRAPWQLSGGQQKRLAIAAILALQPPILLLDEPMASLDPAGRRQVAAVLAELKALAGATVIVLDKNAEFVARWAERILVLADGQIVLDGPPDAIFRQVQRLQALGVATPQMAELAARLDAGPAAAIFLTAQAAAASLGPRLAGGPARPQPADNGNAEPPPLQKRPLAVEVRQVSYAYDGETQALERLSLAVPAGQFVAIVGPNGSGKSTLARHLNGLLQPQAGSLSINGRSTVGRPVGELAQEVGYVFQNPDHQIFATSVREEILFGPRNLGWRGEELAERVNEALAVFGLAELAETPPAVLGYGLRRLVTVASVWAMQPAIWVLDEPMTGLDARYTGELLARLRSLHRAGHTILLITHDLQLVAEAAERVVVLHQGRVVLDGTPAAVLADAESLARFDLRPPPIVRLSALLAPRGFPHPTLTVEAFASAWRAGQESALTIDH